MRDTRGRKVELGDWVCTPWPPIEEMSADLLAQLPEIIDSAVLGRIVEIFAGDDHDEVAHIGNEIILEGYEFITISGFEFTTCVGCGLSWPVDSRSKEEEECPDCGALLSLHDPYWTWTCQRCGAEYPNTHLHCDCGAEL